uniref:Uncharacterized protein n=1 Tax=Clandestinovirus TaxID=2831644 RepID=A0A8F8KTM7_9VIRU|nr:hypothetical protein KOM_12_184 [Clandestinovirus]
MSESMIPKEMVRIILIKVVTAQMEITMDVFDKCIIPRIFKSRDTEYAYGHSIGSLHHNPNKLTFSERGVRISSFTLTALKRVCRKLCENVSQGNWCGIYSTDLYTMASE